MMKSRAPDALGRASRGFTLIELMTVVGIVGVLAVVAYAGYHKFVASAHQTEANNILGGIKMRQERFRAETGDHYLNVSKGLAYYQSSGNSQTGFASLYPHCTVASTPPPGAMKVAWGAACTSACCNPGVDWTKLQVETNGPTFYGFSTIAGASGAPTSTIKLNGVAPSWPAANVGPWFVATAVGDPDGNAIFSTLMVSSFDNTVYVDNDGE